jgi:tetratricopeptide (TPR) repeat protein
MACEVKGERKAMKQSVRLLTLSAAALMLMSGVGCDKLKARSQLNQGVKAYKEAKYEEAIEKFKNAVEFDPTLLNARMYLATAYSQQYIPGSEDAENKRTGEQAIEQYKKVIEAANPSKEQLINSNKGVAGLYLQMKRFDDSRQYYVKVSELDPNDPEPYYSVGVIDWTRAFQPRAEERAKLGLKPTEPLKDKKVCAELHAKSWDTVADGMAMLSKAIELRPDYDDAMAYLNLMYRERADLQCGDPSAYAADEKKADEWVDKNLATKQERAKKEANKANGIVMDEPKQ